MNTETLKENKLQGGSLRILHSESITPAPNDETHSQGFWKNLSLLERSQLLHEALSYLDEDTTEEELELIAETEEKFKEKLIASGYVAQKWDQASETILSEAEVLKEQIKALEKRAAVFANRANSRREIMKNAMLNHNMKKVETPLLTVGLRKKPQKPVETGEASLSGFDPSIAYEKLLEPVKPSLMSQEGPNAGREKPMTL